jgi:hypothetical protein
LNRSRENSTEWDLFISHASEDKDEIVRPLATALEKAGFRVWFDESTLSIGDSLRRSTDKGLAQSRYGLVILSPDFFKKEWPQRELDGLAAREIDGKKVILPVWHKVDREYVLGFSPMLADRLAVSTDDGVVRVVKEVLRAVGPSEQIEEKQQEAIEESTVGRLDCVINFLRGRSQESISRNVRSIEFQSLKRMFFDVLDALAFFWLSDSQANTNIFHFVATAIIERNKEEGSLLFKELLDWYFGTVTSNCKLSILKMFARLTTLSHLKKVISRAHRTSSFVAEFGASNSWKISGINAQILQNIQTSLSETDCKRIVDFALSNDQILDSWIAKNYLRKIVGSCEGKADRGKIEELLEMLSQ